MKYVACVLIEVDGPEEAKEVAKEIQSVCSSKVIDVPYTEAMQQSCWRAKLDKLLTDLGENISHKGYNVMFDIMEYVEKEPSLQNHFSVAELYSYVTEKTGSNYHQIERNIRAMIIRIYDNNSEKHINSVLGVDNDSQHKMTNSRFLSLVIKKLFR